MYFFTSLPIFLGSSHRGRSAFASGHHLRVGGSVGNPKIARTQISHPSIIVHYVFALKFCSLNLLALKFSTRPHWPSLINNDRSLINPFMPWEEYKKSVYFYLFFSLRKKMYKNILVPINWLIVCVWNVAMVLITVALYTSATTT